MFLINTGKAVAAAAATTWNPLDINVAVSLSPNKLTATTSSGAYAAVRGTTSASSGKKYYELHLDSNPSGALIIFGIANSTMPLSDFVGQDNNSIGYDPGAGRIWLNSANTGVQSGTTGDIIGVAVDINNTKFWARTNAGNWNNSVTDDPATNTGGITFSTMAAGPYFPALSLATSPTAATANFGGSAYAQAVPSGFGNW